MTESRPRGDQPRRVTVTNPRTAAARRAAPGARTSVRRELSRQSALGEAVLRSLERAQLRLAVLIAAVVGAVLFGLPLLFLAWPSLRAVQVVGLPLAWLLLGLLVFPVIVVAAWLYVWGAERNERRFSRLVSLAALDDEGSDGSASP